MRTMHVHVESSLRQGQLIRRGVIERKEGERLSSSVTLWFELPVLSREPREDDGEAFLIATLMQAMAERRDLFVHADVSSELLSNLLEYRDAWHCWLPQEYARVEFGSRSVGEGVVGSVFIGALSVHKRHKRTKGT